MLMLQDHLVPSRGRFPRRVADLARGRRTSQHQDGLALALGSSITSVHGLLPWILFARRARRQGRHLTRGAMWGRINYPPC